MIESHEFKDGILYVRIPTGKLDENDAKALVRELDEVIARYNQNRPTPILADITGKKDVAITLAPGRRVFSDWLRHGRCSRNAVVGAPLFVRTVITFIFRLAGYEDRVRCFRDRAEAIAWLKEG